MFSWKTLLGDSNAKTIDGLTPLVLRINDLEATLTSLSIEELKKKVLELKERHGSGVSLDELLPEMFALTREASKRTLGERHFDVQLMGGIILHRRGIAEMKTGEGKTLVATLPASLNALPGNGVHIVTVNDYLSRRDAVWMGQIYDALGFSVGVINHDSSYLYDTTHSENHDSRFMIHESKKTQDANGQKDANALDKLRDAQGSFKVVHEFLRPVSRKEAYAADITYGTNSEFGFDYLRDNLEYEGEALRQKEHSYAIIDEIDSILIDEARTPLIISASSSESGELYHTFAKISEGMTLDQDFKVDEKLRAITLTDDGITKAEKLLGVPNIYTEGGIKYVHHLETAVRAKALFKRDKEYVVKDGEVIIVDEFTGRLQPGRRWSEGLHQAIEAKEGVKVARESRTFASITYQNYFRLYSKLSGMTGTAITSREEFYKVYGLETIAVPTNKPLARFDHNDLIFQTEGGKFKAASRKVRELHLKGQPVLIGTVSIEKNELLSAHLRQVGIPHEILNAKNHEREGEIIAQAGKKGRVTIATNMAGRGVDIKLGGNPSSKEEYEEVKRLGGLFVLGTERHEARRIDNQLRGRAARQGDPGETQFFVSLEDSLMRVFAADTIKKMMGRFGIPEDEPIENRLVTRSLEAAQTKIEGFHFDARKHVLEYDDVLNHQRKIIYERRRKLLVGGREETEKVLEDIILGDEALEKTVAERKAAIGEEAFLQAAKRLLLQTIDLFWVDHLEAMDYLRGSVNLRAYGQRDPLVEYKKEGLRLFKEMGGSLREEVRKLLPNLGTTMPAVEKVKLEEVQEGAQSLTGGSGGGSSVSNEPKIGRNNPCPCGAINPETGKVYKYKQCGLINAPHHKG